MVISYICDLYVGSIYLEEALHIMSRGKPCNHCGFEKPFPFLACVCSTAFSSSLITQITSQKSKNKKQNRTERENETHESKGTKPRN